MVAGWSCLRKRSKRFSGIPFSGIPRWYLPVGEALRHGVAKQGRVDVLCEIGFLGGLLDDLLNASLRVVSSASGVDRW